jgi:hypothetical protein
MQSVEVPPSSVGAIVPVQGASSASASSSNKNTRKRKRLEDYPKGKYGYRDSDYCKDLRVLPGNF